MTNPADRAPKAPSVLKKKLPSLPGEIENPENYLRDIHKVWKAAGGTLAGKSRHSDRLLFEKLKENGTPVRSLTPKLAGGTRIKSDDAEILLRFFLSNWPEPSEDTEAEYLEYAPLLAKEEIDELADYLLERIADASIGGSAETPAQQSLPGQPIAEIIKGIFEESDAYFVVGTERVIVTQDPKTELIGFRDLINAFWTIEKRDNKPRPIIWVMELGRQIFEDFEARQRFLSAQALVTRLKALRLFTDRGREERLEWLQSRAVFFVLDTLFEQPIDIKAVKRPTFLAHHAAFSAIPPEWAKSPNFRTLYGSQLERLDQRNFSVFFSGGGWPSDADGDEDEVRYRRYFGYAPFSVDPMNPNAAKDTRGLELGSPGENYQDAYRTLYAAAVDLLGLENRSQEMPAVAGKQASAQLRYLGFRLMRLDEFMNL